jgi:hypothetical protein
MRVCGGLVAALSLSVAASASALTVDELIVRNLAARGGLDKIRAIQSLRTSGKVRFGGGGFSLDLGFTQMAKRPGMLRQEVSWQGLAAVTAYDGAVGWQIQPFQGRLDPEKLAVDDAKDVRLNADIDGPLVDFKAKGYSVESLGTEDVDGTEAHKLKITLKDGDVRYVYLDPDYFLEIRVLDQTRVRGVEVEQETDLGNYEPVNGVMLPFSIESGAKGGPKSRKFTIEKAEANLALDDSQFKFPAAPAAAR